MCLLKCWALQWGQCALGTVNGGDIQWVSLQAGEQLPGWPLLKGVCEACQYWLGKRMVGCHCEPLLCRPPGHLYLEILSEWENSKAPNCIMLLTCCCGNGKYLIFEGWGRRQRWFLRSLCCLGNPVFTCAKVEVMASMIEIEYSMTEWADKVEVRVQLSCANPYFSLAARVFSQHSATFALACIVNHVVVGDWKPSEPKKKKRDWKPCMAHCWRVSEWDGAPRLNLSVKCRLKF